MSLGEESYNRRSSKVYACKVGGKCTAHIKAKRNEDNGHIDVTYCGTYSYTIRLSHIPIPNHIRINIAEKLQHGVSME